MSRSFGGRWWRYLLSFGAGMVLASLWKVPHTIRRQQAAVEPTGRVNPQIPGPPWGALESLRVPFANSEEIAADRVIRLQPARWFFAGKSREQAAEWLRSAGLDQEQQRKLWESTWGVGTNMCLVRPSNALIRSLSPATRAAIYSALGRDEQNYTQRFPFRFAFENFESRLAEAQLQVDTVKLLRSLIYTNQGTICFADLEVLQDVLKPAELNDVAEFIYRVPAYRVRLRVYPDSDVDALVKYWGKGGREKKIRPWLESLAKLQNTNGTSISIGYLLPEFARVRLDTFPSAWEEKQAKDEDCFWTSMNFFREQPDMSFLDPANVRKALQDGCQAVHGGPEFGDLVTVINDHGDAIHMCVFIAEDFVFTKNGKNPLQPWVIMKIPDMLLSFASDPPPKIVIFRQKG